MFYNYIRYLPPGTATKMAVIESFVLIAIYIFMHMFVFEELAHYLVMKLSYMQWFSMARAVEWTFGWLIHPYGTDLWTSGKQALIVWAVTTPVFFMYRRLQNIIATS